MKRSVKKCSVAGCSRWGFAGGLCMDHRVNETEARMRSTPGATVCSNCAQWQHPTPAGADCSSECAKRGFAVYGPATLKTCTLCGERTGPGVLANSSCSADHTR